jgi:general secretion pathway protein A
MYESFYGLRERPFDLTLDPRFLFLSPRHHEALTHLEYGLSGRPGITLVVGDAGTGKSTLIRAALQSTMTNGSRIAMLVNPTLTRTEFYEHLARAFEFSKEAAASKSLFLQEMESALDACQRAGGVLALLVDEAQSLPNELLEELRLLTNTGADRSLTLVLVGQPELSERLNEPSLRQLKQRVSLRAQLAPLTLKETAGYIASRITVAGGRADLIFTRDAVMAIYEAATGLPRIINVLCDNALVTGFATNVKPVGSAIVAEVCADFDLARSGQAGATAVPSAPPSAIGALRTEPASQDKEEAGESKRFSFLRGARR